jgi:bifunctional polynucleotide phosphatase/kinase
MWEFLEEKLSLTFDKKNSFFVGHGAGRPANWKLGAKADSNCSDRKFAANISVTFFTPEEFFLCEPPANFSWLGVVPSEIPVSGPIADDESDIVSPLQEVILLVGFPSSGKSTFAETHLVPHGYTLIKNRNGVASIRSSFLEMLTEGKSIVIECLRSGEPRFRVDLCKVAKEFNIPVRCFHLQTSETLSKHLGALRERLTGEQATLMVRNCFMRTYTEPCLDEGFSQIKKIFFVRNHPDSNHQKLFEQFSGY